MRQYLSIIMFAGLLLAFGCVSGPNQPHGNNTTIANNTNLTNTTLANPASTFCVNHGGKLEIANEPDGQTGFCTLTNGTRVEEWNYFRSNGNLSEPIACTMDYSPVCGTDNITYGNKCGAHAAGIAISYVGECNQTNQTLSPAEANCIKLGGQLTHADRTYCIFNGTGGEDVENLYAQCNASTQRGIPVCTLEGWTYADRCAAAVAMAHVAYEGTCKFEPGYYRATAENWVRTKDPTFLFDGISDTLVEVPNSAGGMDPVFSFNFTSRHGGFGNRSGQMVTEVLTPHTIYVSIGFESGKVNSARFIDGGLGLYDDIPVYDGPEFCNGTIVIDTATGDSHCETAQPMTESLCNASRGHWGQIVIDPRQDCLDRGETNCPYTPARVSYVCKCGGIAGFQCPNGYECTNYVPNATTPDAMGECKAMGS